MDELIALYQDETSIAELGTRFGVSAKPTRRAVTAESVTVGSRGRHRYSPPRLARSRSDRRPDKPAIGCRLKSSDAATVGNLGGLRTKRF